MVNADAWVEAIAKTLLAMIFGGFCIMQFLAQKSDTAPPTAPLAGKRHGIVITGGSNALYGIAASEMPDALGTGINLSLPSEGGDSLNYIGWLKQTDIETHLAIDSTIYFWVPEKINTDVPLEGPKNSEKRKLLPEKSLLRTLMPSQAASPALPSRYEKDARGDLARHDCNDDALLIPMAISSERLRRIATASGYFAHRLSAIRRAARAKTAMLRVPPILVTEATRQRIEPMLKTLLADLRAHGIPVLQQQALLVTDRSLFCDVAHHPNAKGRTFFTVDLVRALEKQSTD